MLAYDASWQDDWAAVRAAREARTASKKKARSKSGAGAQAAAAARAVVEAPAKAAAAAAAAAAAEAKAAAKAAAKASAEAKAAAAAEAREAAAAEAAAAAAAAKAQARAAAPAAQSQPGDIAVSGCGNEQINGTYRLNGLRDGVPCYRRVGSRHKPAFTIERDTDASGSSEWCICVDFGYDSYCYVKASTELPPANGWATTPLCAGAPPALLCVRGSALPSVASLDESEDEQGEESDEESDEEDEEEEEQPAKSKRSAKRPPLGPKGRPKQRAMRTTKARHKVISKKSAVPGSQKNAKRKILDAGVRLRKK